MESVTLLWLIPVFLILALLIFAYRKTNDGDLEHGDYSIMIVPVIGIILVAGLLIPIITEATDDYHAQYDDYIETTAVSSSGNMELVTIDGVKYAHATGVGEGVLTYSDGSVDTYTISKAELDVWLLTGQSNAAYYGESRYDPDTATPVPKMGTSYYYGTSSAPVVFANPFEPDSSYGIYDMVDTSTNTAKIGNIELPFAGQYQKYTNHKVLVVNGALSGASIEKLIPGGEVYTFMQTAFSDAMSKVNTSYYNINSCGYIWAQGESNSSTLVDSYKMYFMEIYNSLSGQDQAHVFNADYNLPVCMIVQTREADSVNAAEAQEQLAAENDGIFLATTITQTFTVANGLLNGDNVHYTQLGDNKIGVALAKYFFKSIGRNAVTSLDDNVYYNITSSLWELDYEETAGDHTITIEDGKLTVDDTTWDLYVVANFRDTAFVSQYFTLSVGNYIHESYIYEVSASNHSLDPVDDSLVLTIEDGTATAVITSGETSTTYTYPVTWCYVADLEGDYCCTPYYPVYVNNDESLDITAYGFNAGSTAIYHDGVCYHGNRSQQRSYEITSEVVDDTNNEIVKITDVTLSTVSTSSTIVYAIVPIAVEYSEDS